MPRRASADKSGKQKEPRAAARSATEVSDLPINRVRQAPSPPVARVDLCGGPMDLRVESLKPGRRLGLETAGVTLLFSLRAAVVEAQVLGTTMLLDRTHWGVAPARARLQITARSPGTRLLFATAHPPLIKKVVGLYRKVKLDGSRFERWLAVPQCLPRTVWVDEIIQRYLFERQVCAGFDNDATRFLEAEIVKEAYFLLRDREEGVDRASVVQKHSPIVLRALSHVESRLFEPSNIRALAGAVGASESTLLRLFKRELGCTPSAYWRMRRLDEALVLLESGHDTVAQVASTVGYDNPSAFTHAFVSRFGRAPSELLPKTRPRQR